MFAAVPALEWHAAPTSPIATRDEMMLRFAFTTLGRHRVTAAIGPENEASIRVVKRLGFTYEGHLRDHVFTNGAWRDSLLYSLLEHEYDDRSSAGRLKP